MNSDGGIPGRFWMKELRALDGRHRDGKTRPRVDGARMPDAETIWLVAPPTEGGYDYDINLEDCTSSPRILDAMVQVSGKPWVCDASLGAFVRRLDGLLDLQANVCPGGEDQECDPVACLRKTGRIK